MTEECPFCGADCDKQLVNGLEFLGEVHYCEKCNAAKLPNESDHEIGGRVLDGWLQIPRASIELDD